MPVEQGQLRVWDDSMTLDKTPFLVLDKVDIDWQILWNGQLTNWSEGYLVGFSEVISETR